MASNSSNPRGQARRGGLSAIAFLALLAASPGGALAEKGDEAAKKAPIDLASPATEMPDAYKLNMMIRTTLIALNQANTTGNYSVLRDLGTPQFQAMNTDARLGEIFSALRLRQLDLSPLIFFDPKLVRQPAIQPNGILRLTGFFDTKPERVLFDMGFQTVDGKWRLAAIIVDVQPPKKEPAAPPAQAQDQSKNAPKAKPAPAKSTAPPASK